MTLLDNHLEQISLSTAAIAELPFPPPRVFTNALLHAHDITALIRDPEAHERALFSVAPPKTKTREINAGMSRKSNVFKIDVSGEPMANEAVPRLSPRHTTVLATLLGRNMSEQIRQAQGSDVRERGDVDVEILLRGAERLCEIYPIKDAAERIALLRSRHTQLTSSVRHYESRVSRQALQLDRMNRPTNYEVEDDKEVHVPPNLAPAAANEEPTVTVDEIRREEEELRELKKKKRGLEDRVSGMERDLGGLLR